MSELAKDRILTGVGALVSASASGFTQLAKIANPSKRLLCFHFDVTAQALDEFRISGRAHLSAQYIVFGVPGNSWTDPDAADSNIAAGSRILETNADLDTIAAAGNGYFAMDISGLVEVLVEVSAAVDGSLVTPRWSLH